MRTSLVLLSVGITVVPGCIPRCMLPVYFPGVEVTVTNAQTGEPVTDAVVTLSSGEQVETLTGSDGQYSGGGSGTFVLTVEAAGFEGQTIENIVVEQTSDGCYAVTEFLEVKLNPVPG